MRSWRDGWVYALYEPSTSLVKIGCSKYPAPERLRQIKAETHLRPWQFVPLDQAA